MVALELFTEFNCCVVFLGADLKERYYKGAAFQPYCLLSGHKVVESKHAPCCGHFCHSSCECVDQVIMVPVIDLGG